MVPHIDRLVHAGFYQLRCLQTIHCSVTTATAILLVNCFVVTRIDYYCNSLLVSRLISLTGSSECWTMLHAWSVLHGRGKYDQVMPLLRDNLHWLLVPERVTFKCCLLMYIVLNGQASGYITDFCIRVPVSERHSTIRLAGSIQFKLFVPRRVDNFAELFFSVSGSTRLCKVIDICWHF